jgi:hypothetical protein
MRTDIVTIPSFAWSVADWHQHLCWSSPVLLSVIGPSCHHPIHCPAQTYDISVVLSPLCSTRIEGKHIWGILQNRTDTALWISAPCCWWICRMCISFFPQTQGIENTEDTGHTGRKVAQTENSEWSQVPYGQPSTSRGHKKTLKSLTRHGWDHH